MTDEFASLATGISANRIADLRKAFRQRFESRRPDDSKFHSSADYKLWKKAELAELKSTLATQYGNPFVVFILMAIASGIIQHLVKEWLDN